MHQLHPSELTRSDTYQHSNTAEAIGRPVGNVKNWVNFLPSFNAFFASDKYSHIRAMRARDDRRLIKERPSTDAFCAPAGPPGPSIGLGQDVACMAGVARSGDTLERGNEYRECVPAAPELGSVLRDAGNIGPGSQHATWCGPTCANARPVTGLQSARATANSMPAFISRPAAGTCQDRPA